MNMPYKTRKEDGKYCVYKKDGGKKVGCTAGTKEAKRKYLAALHIAEDEEYEAEKYYAKFGGRIVGPYDTEEDAYYDTKGDVQWIKKGEDLRKPTNLKEAKQLQHNQHSSSECAFDDVASEILSSIHLDNEVLNDEDEEDHEPRNPGILKRRIKGKITCSKARALKGSMKDKGSDTAKAAQRFLNYHDCDEEDAEKKVSKLRSKCQAKAKRKYDVWPSAYASGYVQKCVNRKGNIK